MHARTNDTKLHRFALATVAIGASTGILATAYVWLTRGEFESTTFVASLSALAAAFPVWYASKY